jgi:hypothetical protein
MKNLALFYHYQTALICLSSSIPEMSDVDKWVRLYEAKKNSLLADITGDFLAGNLTEEEYDKLMKAFKLLKNI